MGFAYRSRAIFCRAAQPTIRNSFSVAVSHASGGWDARRYFNNCPIFTIPGRTFPVEVLYTKAPESDYLDAALITVMQVRRVGSQEGLRARGKRSSGRSRDCGHTPFVGRCIGARRYRNVGGG